MQFQEIKKGTTLKLFPFVGRAGFEPTKALPTDLQSAPFDRFGISPKKVGSCPKKYLEKTADSNF